MAARPARCALKRSANPSGCLVLETCPGAGLRPGKSGDKPSRPRLLKKALALGSPSRWWQYATTLERPSCLILLPWRMRGPSSGVAGDFPFSRGKKNRTSVRGDRSLGDRPGGSMHVTTRAKSSRLHVPYFPSYGPAVEPGRPRSHTKGGLPMVIALHAAAGAKRALPLGLWVLPARDGFLSSGRSWDPVLFPARPPARDTRLDVLGSFDLPGFGESRKSPRSLAGGTTPAGAGASVADFPRRAIGVCLSATHAQISRQIPGRERRDASVGVGWPSKFSRPAQHPVLNGPLPVPFLNPRSGLLEGGHPLL